MQYIRIKIWQVLASILIILGKVKHEELDQGVNEWVRWTDCDQGATSSCAIIYDDG